uniref:Uncharacterized protein n=1 Tax=Nelumbo nucifera TaxID=4432 RepID=A0A822YT87_NELNU|nr:TPA_asm: hypothetical protein HUJ06_011289 [Nelumbo nucifera]
MLMVALLLVISQSLFGFPVGRHTLSGFLASALSLIFPQAHQVLKQAVIGVIYRVLTGATGSETSSDWHHLSR